MLDTFRDGQLLWRYEDGDKQRVASFTIFQDNGYLLTRDATLHALDLITGQETGRMEFKPRSVPATTSHHLTTTPSLLLLRYGNHQLFAFESALPNKSD
jgi:hypothetical protein